MPELLLELFSEEIPARMQARAAEDLATLLTKALAGLAPRDVVTEYGPRRIALTLTLDAEIPATTRSERGPRETAPEQALAGFTRKHGVTPDALTRENGFWVLTVQEPAITASDRIATAVPDLLWRFPWPKSMRWGNGSQFTWVRPLRRILCLLDGKVVPFALATETDDAHGLKADALSEGHRFLNPGSFTVTSATQWREELRARHIVFEASARRAAIQHDLHALADRETLDIVPDPGLIDEVAGLAEYPVAFLGTIAPQFMNLPAEVMQVSMRVNQRYFALRHKDGRPAARFGFIANMLFSDGGTLTTAGNERVLAARFADARHFWDLDRSRTLESRIPALDAVTFHAKLGTQGARATRIARMAGIVAEALGQDARSAARAGELAKADLTTGMVGEFPELQGIMGGYYARHDGETSEVAQAIAEHYKPRGAEDTTPTAPLAIAVALADRLDMLAGFFAINETPTGSGDPYGLRRAALGIIRIIRDNGLRLNLNDLFTQAAEGLPETVRATPNSASADLPAFMTERLRVQLRSEGARHDVLSAILAGGLDGDLTRLLARTGALADMLATEDGRNLLAASKRAANILRIEDKKDGPHTGLPNPKLYTERAEHGLAEALTEAIPAIHTSLKAERFAEAMRAAANLRPALDRFFETVTVNAEDPTLRKNRLQLLTELNHALHPIADFSQIEG